MTDSTVTTEDRVQPLRIASEIVHKEAVALKLEPVAEDDITYQGILSLADLYTQIADHADDVHPDVLAAALLNAQSIIDGEAEDLAATDEELRENFAG